jgi:hypothetical protein
MIPAPALIFVALSFALMGCDEEKPKNQYVLKEAIHVKGTCSENHVGRPDSYAGQIVRWQTIETGQVLTYGSLMRTRVNWQQRTIDEAMHPTAYHTPFMISFTKIDIDTNQPQWVLYGVSVRGDDGSDGYDSTCEVEVVKRGGKLWEMGETWKWLED